MTTEHQNKETGHKTFAEKVNEVVSTMTKNSSGVWQLPEGEHSEEVQFASMAEKRRRDTQSSYVKATQSLSESNIERDALRNKLASTLTLQITPAQNQELNDLKVSDPEAWKAKLEMYESAAKTALATEITQFGKDAIKDSRVVSRELVLKEYTEANPGFSLTDDILANDVPARITNKLENGEITFADFLGEVHNYLTSNKVISKQTETQQDPNLGALAGGSSPSEAAAKGSVEQSYGKTDIF